ncbi:MAG: Fe-S cluster assembly ATPase SufC [Dehalococcoidia bacterium]|nr:Fe-S cluster assembly ATPase SufC [Dehalococcoidia bacterium]
MTTSSGNGTAPLFQVEALHVSVEGKEILKGVDLIVRQGEVHAIMGPNGSGKSTLANAIMGHPKYKVTGGDIRYLGQSIVGLKADQRARLGVFLAFQYPTAIPGVTMVNFLRHALNAVRGQEVPVKDFRNLLRDKMTLLKVDRSFSARYVNEGFSGGEKKRVEMLQMAVLEPKLAVLDETDSGLDIDALKTVAEGINTLLNPAQSILLITHYQRILNYVKPHFVHVLAQGNILKSGGPELALELEAKGYDWILKEAAALPQGVSS